jgi:pantoate--beta-alanine ligase
MNVAANTREPSLVASGEEVRQWVVSARRARRRVGLVPTMGALHEGHLSLVDASRTECDLTVVSIFVNPTQFGPGEDYHHYPRDLQADMRLLSAHGTDMVFAPSSGEMYPVGHETSVDAGSVARPLEGEFRPTHFRGVATIVLKLFNLIPADRAYFGQKDYQQTLVVRQLVRDLHVPIEVRTCPIVRERDGLAMSSRNAYLSPAERRQARAIWESLQLATQLTSAGERDVRLLRRRMTEFLSERGISKVDYIAFVRDGTVDELTIVDGRVVLAVAAWVGTTRLLDNCLITGPRSPA